MRLAILDNRDSFIWNIVHLARDLGAEVTLLEASSANLRDFQNLAPDAILIGPGPGHPRQAKLSFELFQAFPQLPILGICLGHQVLGLCHGAKITGAPVLAHGRPVQIVHEQTGIFQYVPSPCHAGRYHSLTLSPDEMPATLAIIARSPDDEILAIKARQHPHVGLQFHPESLLSNCGPALLGNFLGTKRPADL